MASGAASRRPARGAPKLPRTYACWISMAATHFPLSRPINRSRTVIEQGSVHEQRPRSPPGIQQSAKRPKIVCSRTNAGFTHHSRTSVLEQSAHNSSNHSQKRVTGEPLQRSQRTVHASCWQEHVQNESTPRARSWKNAHANFYTTIWISCIRTFDLRKPGFQK